MAIILKKFEVEEDLDVLYVKYSGQVNPQPVVLEIDFDRSEATIRVNAEIGNGIPGRVFDGRALWIPGVPPGLFPEAANRLLDECEDLINNILDLHEVYTEEIIDGEVWRAKNQELQAELGDTMRDFYDSNDILIVFAAADYYSGVQSEVIERMRKGEDPEVNLWETDQDGNAVLIEGRQDYLERLTKLAIEKEVENASE